MRLIKWLMLLAVALTVIVADQVTKALVIANLAPYEEWMPIEALRPYFTIHHVRNTGAAFGILPGGGTLLMIIALVVVGVIIYFYRQLPERVWLVRVALGLQLGGAVGNLIDRVRLGYVIDFFDVKFWPVFNIADSSIVVGVFALLILMWWADRRAKLTLPGGDQGPPDSRPSEDEPSSVAPG